MAVLDWPEIAHYNQSCPPSTFKGQTADEVYKKIEYKGHAPDQRKKSGITSPSKL